MMFENLRKKPLPDEETGTEESDVLTTARDRYRRASKADDDNREWALEDLEFLAGEQWPEEIERERTADKRPTLVVNLMPQFVHQVTGDLRQNRPSIKVRPVDNGADPEKAELRTGLIRHIENQSDTGSPYMTAAESAAQCGIGHWFVSVEYSDDDTFEQDIWLRPINDFQAVTWDPSAKLPTREDAQYCFVEEMVEMETFKARYPNSATEGFDFQDKAQSWIGDWLTHDGVRVAEYWTKTPEPGVLALMGDGTTQDITKARREEIEPGKYLYYGKDGEVLDVKRVRKVERDKIELRIITGVEVLEGPFRWHTQHIPVVPVLGEIINVGRKTVRHGVIRHAKDPQRMYNFWRSAQTEQLALQPKAPFIATAAQISGHEDQWKVANTRSLPYLLYNPDENTQGRPPERTVPPLASQGMALEVQVAAQDMKKTTGIYDAGLGERSQSIISGKAIREQKQESDVSTFTYADNLARSLRLTGRILVDLIPKIYDTERAFLIVGEDDSETVTTVNQVVTDDAGKEVTLNDLSVGKYDVTVTVGPSYSTKRAEAADGMMQLIQGAPKVAELILDLLVKNMDWPGADEIADRIRKTLPPGLAEPQEGDEDMPPPPPTPEMIEAQQKGEIAVAEEERKRAETESEIAKTDAETQGKMLENMEKQMMLAVQSGEMRGVLEQIISETLAAILEAQEGTGPGAAAPAPTPPAPGAGQQTVQ